jgi:hypothetical protein
VTTALCGGESRHFLQTKLSQIGWRCDFCVINGSIYTWFASVVAHYSLYSRVGIF